MIIVTIFNIFSRLCLRNANRSQPKEISTRIRSIEKLHLILKFSNLKNDQLQKNMPIVKNDLEIVVEKGITITGFPVMPCVQNVNNFKTQFNY